MLSKNGIVVWLDADEVLVRFKKYFHSFLRTNYNISISDDYTPTDWYYQCLFGSKEKCQEILQSLPLDWPLYLEAYSGASAFTHQLKSLGCRVIVITHMSSEKGPARIRNFVSNNIHFDEIYFTWGRDKCDFFKELLPRFGNKTDSTHIFVDDKALNIKQIFDGVPGMLDYAVTLDVPYNSEVFESCATVPSNLFERSCSSQKEMYNSVISRVLELSIVDKNNKIPKVKR